MKNFFKKKTAIVLAGSAAMGSTLQAQAYDWSTITAGFDFTGEIAAVAATVGILASVMIVVKGGRIVLGMLR